MDSVLRPVSALRDDERRDLVDAVCTCQGRDVEDLERALEGGLPKASHGAPASDAKR